MLLADSREVPGDFPGATVQQWVLFLMGTTLPDRPFVPVTGIVALLERIGYAAGATRVALSRLHAETAVERARVGRTTSYRMTDDAVMRTEAVAERVARFGRDVVWDGTWTLVLMSLPDDQRATRRKVRNHLAYLGFGRLRETAWLAARHCETDVEALVDDLDAGKFVDIFVGGPSRRTELSALLDRCWDLDALTTGYERFETRFAPLRPVAARRRLTADEELLWWLQLTHDYRELVHRDPELPPDLLPERARARRDRAVDTYQIVHGGLVAGASAEVRRTLAITQ